MSLGVYSTDAVAQPVSEDENITLERAIQIAVEQNPAVRRASDQVDLAGTAVTTRRLEYVPSVGLSLSGGHTYGRTFSTDVGGFAAGMTNMNVGTSASMTVFDGFSREARVSQARNQLHSQERTRDRVQQDVAIEATERFYALTRQEAIVELRRAELELRQDQLEQIEMLIEAGTRPPTERYQQETAMLEAEQALLEAERTVEVSRAQLMKTLALNPAGNYRFATDELREVTLPDLEDASDPTAVFSGATSYADDVPPLEVLIDEAMSNRSDIQALALDSRAAEQGVRAARGNYWPQVSLNAGYNSRWNSITDDPFLDQLDQERSGSVGLSLSFPIFERMQRRHSVEQAQVQLRQAQYEMEDQERDLALQLREARAQWEQTVKALEVAEQRLEAANRALDAAEERYQLGAAPLVELREATAEQARAASSLVQTRFDLRLQRAYLDYLRGLPISTP